VKVTLSTQRRVIRGDGRQRHIDIDAIELDATKHGCAEGEGRCGWLRLLEVEAGAIYSHIIMNPPFADGAKHVLKAWDILFDGEMWRS